MRPAVLFARRDSIYKTLDCDVWDEDRDARKWPGGAPVVVHPPCRLWSKLAPLSKAPIEEKQLAIFAVAKVREFGSVLEHPAHSKLWECLVIPGERLPAPGKRDSFGGFTISVPQWWWGHKAEKMTWLYVCRLLGHLPEMPFKLGEATHVVSSGYARFRGDRGRSMKPEVSKREREAPPPPISGVAPCGGAALRA